MRSERQLSDPNHGVSGRDGISQTELVETTQEHSRSLRSPNRLKLSVDPMKEVAAIDPTGQAYVSGSGDPIIECLPLDEQGRPNTTAWQYPDSKPSNAVRTEKEIRSGMEKCEWIMKIVNGVGR